MGNCAGLVVVINSPTTSLLCFVFVIFLPVKNKHRSYFFMRHFYCNILSSIKLIFGNSTHH